MNDNVLEAKIKNLTFTVLIGFIILGILIIGLYFKEGTTNKNLSTNTNTTNNENTGNTGNNGSTAEYDVSKMKAVNVEQALALFKEKGTHVLYIGRADCSSCVMTVPYLNQVQQDLNYTTNYFDLNQTTNYKTEMKELAEKFDIKATANGVTGTIASLFLDKGYTPTVIIIKDGKAVDGFIGNRDYNTIKALVSKYL